jgi:malate permease and related proteins
VILAFIALDRGFLHFYTTVIHQVMVLASIVPLAANTVAIATELKTQPEKAALAVLLSTVFALFYIPTLVTLFMV